MENQNQKLEAKSFSPSASWVSSASLNRDSLLLSSIVLAGGMSSRMGEDKALLTVGGVPLLRIVCDVAIALCETVYVVTPWTERYQHLLPPECQFIHEVQRVEENEDKKKISNSPLVGFAQGLAHVTTDWVLLLACDLPRLQVEVLRDWVTQLNNVDNEAIALLTRHAKGWDPLCGFYRRSCLPALMQYIDRGGRSFQQWLAQHSVQVLPLSDAQMLFNCNTPADYKEINAQLL
ncbi:MAG TPA: molybdenum cofactor guanylyltransferase [Leptolyngbyaceae cyanobacterium]